MAGRGGTTLFDPDGVGPGATLAFEIAKPRPGGMAAVRFLHRVYGSYLAPTGPALVTGAPVTDVPRPARVEGRTILDNGFHVLRHDFLGQWFNLCLFFSPEGRLTGYYCDLQTPLCLEGSVARCTDLLLDLWIFADGGCVRVLDRDEYASAVREGFLPPEQRRRAAAALRYLLDAVRRRRVPHHLTGDAVPPAFLQPRS
jgi:predicted RNA-binding protein associated with RNAse of E/G family